VPDNIPAPDTSFALTLVKSAHTVIWAVFAGFIIAIPVVSWYGNHVIAAWLAAAVACEVLVLILNKLRCPLTAVAARYTDDRRDNFDIYLPVWLAKHNKRIFGTLYFAGVAFALARWILAPGLSVA